nr:peptidylprolyl isomerase [Neochlamydia sp. AcF84]
MNAKKNPIVLLTTSMGNIKLELYPEKAPLSVKNFVDYVESGHFNQTIFHRVIDGFMIQGGGFNQEFDQKPTKASIKNEAHNGLKNIRGSIAMARTNEIHSASSQFFINLVDNDFLNFRSPAAHEYGYCVFGQVIEGLEVVDKIGKVKTGSKGPHRDVPLETVEILSATQAI